MADLPPPVLLSVVVGECLHRAWGNRRFSISNIRNHIKTDAFPFQVEKFGVYVAVTEVVRDTQIAVRLVAPNGDVLSTGPTWDLKAGRPLFVHEFGSDFEGVEFREAGYYALRVTADGDMLGEWRIWVQGPEEKG